MSDDKKPPQKPMSIEQAGNFLKEKNENLAKDIHNEAEKQQISVAPARDRIAYLTHALSYLDDVSPEVERAFLTITRTISSSLTRKQIAGLLQKILVARVYGFGICTIVQALKEPMEMVAQLEELGKIAAAEQIHKKGLAGLPIFGTN